VTAKPAIDNPFGDLVGLDIEQMDETGSIIAVMLAEKHLNPHRVAHGAVAYALADTGMGAALYPHLDASESCATIEVKISYLQAVNNGKLTASTQLLRRGSRVAFLESVIKSESGIVATATGSYSIFARRK